MTHAPGRVLGFADYLSRHPSDLKGQSIQAEELRNDWFTVNIVNKFNVIDQKASPLEHPSPIILTRAKDSVLKVDNEANARTSVIEKRASEAQPIRGQDGSIRRKQVSTRTKLLVLIIA